MKYFALFVIIGGIILNFKIYTDYKKDKVAVVAVNSLYAETLKKQSQGVTAKSGKSELVFETVGKMQLSVDASKTVAKVAIAPTVRDRVSYRFNATGERVVVKAKKNTMKTPAFIRGIYLHNYSATKKSVLKRYVKNAKKYGINSFVLDQQDAVKFKTYMVPKANVQMCITNGIYPIARIVVFPYGLKSYPVSKAFIKKRLDIAERAAKNGFPQVQFDYIRFEDTGRMKWVSLKKRYQVIEGFLAVARKRLAKYGTKISADVFGRVALNRRDKIGQRLEGLDKVVDYICPMVYPSHYGWSSKMMSNPWYTVYHSGVIANKRLKKAGLVMYIQGFIMRVSRSGLSLPTYIAHQIKASEDAKTRGYIVWNAAQRYWPTYKAIALLKSGKPLAGSWKIAKAFRPVYKKKVEKPKVVMTNTVKTKQQM